MIDKKKKIAIVSLAVFTVFAVAAICVILFLNFKLKGEVATVEEPTSNTTRVEKVEVKTQDTPPEKASTPELVKPDLKKEVVVEKEDVKEEVVVKEVEEVPTSATEDVKVEEKVEEKDPNFEDFKFVQNLDIYGYNCVVTSTDGMTTITYPSDLVPVDFLLFVAKEVSEAYPEECSYVTFALNDDLIILSYPNTFTEFDTWLYLDVLASDIPIFASWLFDGTYQAKQEEKVEEAANTTSTTPVEVKEEEVVSPVVLPFTPEIPLPEAPILSVVEKEIKSEEKVEDIVEVKEENKGLKVSVNVGGGYTANYVDNLTHGVNISLGLELENIATFNNLSFGLGLDTGLEIFDNYHSILSDITLNLRYFVNQKLSVAGKVGARILLDKNPNSGVFSLGNYNAHFGFVVGTDLKYMFNKNMGFGLDVRYSYLLDLGHRVEAKAYMSFTF